MEKGPEYFIGGKPIGEADLIRPEPGGEPGEKERITNASLNRMDPSKRVKLISSLANLRGESVTIVIGGES